MISVNGILILYHHHLKANAPTIMEHVNSFSNHSRFAVWEVNTELGFLRGIKDSQCGFKLFRRDMAKNAFLQQRIEGFSFDVEVLYIARKNLQARIREIPVEWSDSAKLSKVRAGRETFRMLKDLFRIRMLH